MTTPTEIAYAVSRVTGVSLDEMRSSSRHRTIVRARRTYARLCRELTHASFPEIGEYLWTVHTSAITWNKTFRKTKAYHTALSDLTRSAA